MFNVPPKPVFTFIYLLLISAILVQCAIQALVNFQLYHIYMVLNEYMLLLYCYSVYQ